MTDSDWSTECRILASAGASIAPGLTDDELKTAERAHGFRFPVDLRSMLSSFLPVGPEFPDWRNPDSDGLRDRLGWPFDGIAFDIENNSFWWDTWGVRPASLTDALAMARASIDAAPRLIPVFGHRYLASPPTESGNPVFSVWQTDIIYYGRDLRSYLRCEFGDRDWPDAVQGECRYIAFWTDLVERED